MAAGSVIRVCLFLFCFALLHRSAQSIRPLADAALLPGSSAQLGQRALLNFVSEFQFASEVKTAFSAISGAGRRRSLKKGAAISSPPSPTNSPPPSPSVSTNYVEEGYR